jgi:hypothetical protein
MLKTLSIHRAAAMVVAMVLLIAFSRPLQAAPPGQLGLVSVTPEAVSGGQISYKFDIEVFTPGTLVVKAKVVSKPWKSAFPVFTATPSAGVTEGVTGPSVSIPSTFTGTAVLRLSATLNGKKLGARTVPFTVVTAPPPGTFPTVTKTLYDVGFENEVTLDGTLVSTTGLATPTYSWTQLAGMPATLSSASAVSPTFTTGHLTNFVDMAEKLDGEIDGIGLDAEQVAESTYKFQLVVSGNSQSRTGIYTVVCASSSPKQPNTPVGLLTYFKAGSNSTDWALLSKPPGSSATLLHPDSLTPALRPDVEGTYVIKDNVTGGVRTNTGASWTGYQFCAICHGPGNDLGLKDMVTPWSQTGHASFFKERINTGPAYYNESCISCHTVGYNKAPTANNNGFDDVATANGWTFPSSINSNNWDNMPIPLQAKANIQCENCHGPGSRHPGPTSVSLNVAVCAQCHQDGHYHTRVEQWERSPHFKGFKEVSEEEGDNATCARCHSPNGFVDVAKRIASGQDIVTASKTNNYATGHGELICQGCHDPHHTFDNPDRHQLRIFDTVVLGNPAAAGSVVLSNQGASATCMYCHNTRRLPMQLSGGQPQYRAQRSGQIAGPHESTAAEIFNGLGGVEYGVPMGNTFHTYGANCVMCHMYPNPAIGQPGHNQVGDHTFNMTYLNGDTEVENIAACNQCHAGAFAVNMFDFKSAAAKDWDGDGVTNGVQTETQGLLDRVRTLLNDTGLVSVTNALGETTGYRTNGLSATFEIREAQLKAAWNWMMINREGSHGVHNPLYTIRLLQNTWTDLNTNWTGDVNATFKNTFPNATLR